MKTYIIAAVLTSLILLVSCSDTTNAIANRKEYQYNLELQNNTHTTYALNEIAFWKNKLKESPHQISWIGRLASANTLAFSATGIIDYLKEAESLLQEANERTQFKNAGFLRAIARNYISQHRFKEALQTLEKAVATQDDLTATHKMLFDVYLELGKDTLAKTTLETIKKEGDFDYYIRLAKWQDHKGKLQEAIYTLEKAARIATDANSKELKIWTYSNLADFYGHAGRIADAYQHYLKTLQLDPHNAYALKGIAWIAYAHDQNPEEALAIIDAILTKYSNPDLYVLKAEIATTLGDKDLKEQAEQSYEKLISKKGYGEMYNSYQILLLADQPDKHARAMQIAKREILNRATPSSYDLLAWVYYQQGNITKAAAIVEQQVYQKTFEPEAMYHMAEIFKAAGQTNKVVTLKKELQESYFELGPLLKVKIEKL
ncbi:tetratricopeptide repeat protein [Ascidiimonas sp. W6]|uniref:tetratricopeptide repeat protein n=1 Tax=Ascidiimonas meishanensis TaxID=3128903 RepID=UPI0030ECB301